MEAVATMESSAKADTDRQGPMSQLRNLRDLQRRVERLIGGRDELIRKAAAAGFTQQQIANAAGLSQSRVQEVITHGSEADELSHASKART